LGNFLRGELLNLFFEELKFGHRCLFSILIAEGKHAFLADYYPAKNSGLPTEAGI